MHTTVISIKVAKRIFDQRGIRRPYADIVPERIALGVIEARVPMALSFGPVVVSGGNAAARNRGRHKSLAGFSLVSGDAMDTDFAIQRSRVERCAQEAAE